MGGSHHAFGSVLSYIKVEDSARRRVDHHAHVMMWKYKSTIFLLKVIWGHPHDWCWHYYYTLLPPSNSWPHTRNLFNIRMNHDNDDHLDVYISNQNIYPTTSLLGKRRWQQHRLEMWHISSPTQVTMSPWHKGYRWGSSQDAKLELSMLFIYLFFISTLLFYLQLNYMYGNWQWRGYHHTQEPQPRQQLMMTPKHLTGPHNTTLPQDQQVSSPGFVCLFSFCFFLMRTVAQIMGPDNNRRMFFFFSCCFI